jgi:hypothetical protein
MMIFEGDEDGGTLNSFFSRLYFLKRTCTSVI